jgi:hypothetical protein
MAPPRLRAALLLAVPALLAGAVPAAPAGPRHCRSRAVHPTTRGPRAVLLWYTLWPAPAVGAGGPGVETRPIAAPNAALGAGDAVRTPPPPPLQPGGAAQWAGAVSEASGPAGDRGAIVSLPQQGRAAGASRTPPSDAPRSAPPRTAVVAAEPFTEASSDARTAVATLADDHRSPRRGDGQGRAAPAPHAGMRGVTAAQAEGPRAPVAAVAGPRTDASTGDTAVGALASTDAASAGMAVASGARRQDSGASVLGKTRREATRSHRRRHRHAAEGAGRAQRPPPRADPPATLGDADDLDSDAPAASRGEDYGEPAVAADRDDSGGDRAIGYGEKNEEGDEKATIVATVVRNHGEVSSHWFRLVTEVRSAARRDVPPACASMLQHAAISLSRPSVYVLLAVSGSLTRHRLCRRPAASHATRGLRRALLYWRRVAFCARGTTLR